MITFYLYDRWGNQIDTITDVLQAVHKDELNGEDSLTLEVVGRSLEKGQRIVWRDKFRVWHEHIVNDLDIRHEQGQMITNAYCENSIAELLTDYVVDKRPTGSAQVALVRALEDTRWTSGVVTRDGYGQTNWYHVSVYEAIKDIIDVWGGELSTSLTISGDQITSRQINIEAKRGDDVGQLFTYGRNLTAISRVVDPDEVYTALYGYGKGLEMYDEDGNPTGGYSRKLTFGDVNGGQNWIGDDDAKQIWGLPDGKGGIKHTFGKVEFDQCEDPNELLELTKAALEQACHPRVTYKGSVVSLAAGGLLNGEDTRTGDTVYIRDKVLDLRLEGRAICVERDLVNEYNTVITLGNITSTLTDKQRELENKLGWLNDHATSWDSAAGITSAYINAIINQWNEAINADGGFVYWEQGEGITVYDRPIDQNPTKAIQIKGGAFRIANSKLPNGDWDWRTFGTGDGFTADLINVGILRGGSCWWNLETGDLFFNHGTISSPGNSWDLDTGYLTFHHGRIEDATGKNYWDLDTGYFMTKQGHIGGFEITDHAIYSGNKNSITSNNAGVYVGDDGISVGTGDWYITMADGYLRGGKGSSTTGYIHFYSSVLNGDNKNARLQYGTRVAGQQHVSILTPNIGVGNYAAYNADAVVTLGKTRTINYGTSLSASGSPSPQRGSINAVTSGNSVTINNIVCNIRETGPAFGTRGLGAVATNLQVKSGAGTVISFKSIGVAWDGAGGKFITSLNSGSVSVLTGYSGLGPTSYKLNTSSIAFTKGLLTTV